ncbi:PEN family class A beta-lactamase, Bpc-type [Saccharopolyspora halophila]|uniref:Beta-lactamase n=1 Tax=Saccharopolyspora halophila TaxID=405551 RepID=A0ABP5T3A5_9PSEU
MSQNISRRSVLGALLAAPVVACAPRSSPASATDAPGLDAELLALEHRFDARLGLFARNAATGRTLANRADERAAMCSTFKVYAVGALLRERGLAGGHFERRITYGRGDLVEYSPITETRVDTGMTIGELCAAALQHSDNTAANLLLRELGGPRAIAPFARSIGDDMTRLDRWETELNSAVPGDERDTTTPAAYASGLQRLLLGDVLAGPERRRLTDWMLGNTTGDDRIRAGLPGDWRTADKTGGGSYGVANDVAVTWTSAGTPIVVALFTRRHREHDEHDDALLAEAARVVARRLA